MHKLVRIKTKQLNNLLSNEKLNFRVKKLKFRAKKVEIQSQKSFSSSKFDISLYDGATVDQLFVNIECYD